MPEVSIVVPIYNVERYIKQCLDSIIAQTFSDFEAILVDDGSSDGSGRICDEYALKDWRFRAFHKQNAGVAEARNTGIKNCIGKYICFVDPDDWIDENTIEMLHSEISRKQSSFVACGYYVESNHPRIVIPEGKTSGDNCEDILLLFARRKLSYALWNKIYASEIILQNKIWFYPGIKYVEDHAFNLKYISCCDALAVLPLPLYHYRSREGQITGEDSLKRLPTYIKDTFWIIDDFKKMGLYDGYKHILIVHFINRFSEYFGGFMCSKAIPKKDKLRAISATIELYKEVGFSKVKIFGALTPKEKIFKKLIELGKPELIFLMYHIYNIILIVRGKA